VPCPGSSGSSSTSSSSGFCGSLSALPTTGASSLLLPPPGSRTDLDVCCSLLNNTWKYCANDDKEAVDVESNPSNAYPFVSCFTARGRPTVQGPNLPVAENQGSYFSTPSRSRVIVNIDVEQIGPNDQPHHPYDHELLPSSSTVTTSPRKMFIRKPWGIAINSKTEQVLSPLFSS